MTKAETVSQLGRLNTRDAPSLPGSPVSNVLIPLVLNPFPIACTRFFPVGLPASIFSSFNRAANRSSAFCA
ncbi:hypothetical protein ACFV0O_28710 [Kitasatospora sp. NPDC059577]|uniref:hypothetical protein n=1 Tax=Kitasatospora sp. NPDC059577 TaxID=3346873 RepID=UPI003691E7CF